MKAKTTSATVSTAPPMPGMACSNAAADNAAPLSPLVQTPEQMMARPVIEQMMMVSMKVPIMPMMPERTELVVVPAAWAIPAVPRPASLEKMPRATPKRIAAMTAAPAKPPVAAIGVKAWVKIRLKAVGIASTLTTSTTIPAMMYATHMKGTNAAATLPIRLMPPRMTSPTTTMVANPVTQSGTLNVVCSAWAMLLTCTMLPMPKPASPPKMAKAPPSQSHFLPRPFLMAYIGPPTCSPRSSFSR